MFTFCGKTLPPLPDTGLKLPGKICIYCRIIFFQCSPCVTLNLRSSSVKCDTHDFLDLNFPHIFLHS